MQSQWLASKLDHEQTPQVEQHSCMVDMETLHGIMSEHDVLVEGCA